MGYKGGWGPGNESGKDDRFYRKGEGGSRVIKRESEM